MMAAAYGLPPHYFDEWDIARFERELEIYGAIRNDGETPLTVAVFAEFMAVAFGGGE